MGRDKSRLRLGGRTLTAHLRGRVAALGVPLRVLRRDLVPRCGPLGGVYSALRTTRASGVLFLACDMPFVPISLLQRLVARFRRRGRALFTINAGVRGFPFVVPRAGLPVVERSLAHRQFALHTLADQLEADDVAALPAEANGLFNINTRAEWSQARARWRQTAGSRDRGGGR